MTPSETVTSDPGPGGPLLEVSDLRTLFRTPRGSLKAVDGISFTLGRGRTLGVVGESGSGKTVLARSVMGLLTGDNLLRSGKVVFEGTDLVTLSPPALRRLWGRRISMIFQDPMTSLNPVMRVGTQITESLRLHLDMDKKSANVPPSSCSGRSAYPRQRSGTTRFRTRCRVACASG